MKAIDARLSFVAGDGHRKFPVDVELSLDSGVLVLFGPSGAGKTLTLAAIAGLRSVDAGHLRVGGDVLLDTARGVVIPPEQRRVGYVPQSHALFPFLDVASNVAFGLPRSERRSARGRVRVDELLRELGIAHLAPAHPGSLSGGERQRVAIARALAPSPRLLLLDEPFASIDEQGTTALREVVRTVIQRHSVPAILVTHDMDDARMLGDRAVRFEGGRSVDAGTPAALLACRSVTVRGTIESVVRGDDGSRGRLADAVIEGAEGSFAAGPVVLHDVRLGRGPGGE